MLSPVALCPKPTAPHIAPLAAGRVLLTSASHSPSVSVRPNISFAPVWAVPKTKSVVVPLSHGTHAVGGGLFPSTRHPTVTPGPAPAAGVLGGEPEKQP